tara:strand:+ start:333 stop:1004 length:672 start_codon:yes stop_codon:yes gene_type:complete
MSCLALTAAPFDESNNQSATKGNSLEKPKAKRGLLTNASPMARAEEAQSNARVANVMQAISSKSVAPQVRVQNAGQNLAEFQPLPATTGSCARQPRAPASIIPGIGGMGLQNAAAVTGSKEGFENSAHKEEKVAPQTNDVFHRMLPLFAEVSGSEGPSQSDNNGSARPQNDLMRKLNRIIDMLEEQEDSRTGHVVEELVLYGFLGVFVIYIVDSFARAGKYVR